MAIIADFLEKIKDAQFGIDVRDSIHDGIKAINDEVEANTLASNEAVQSASASAASAANAETAANKAKDDVAAVKTDIYNTAIPQIQQIKADTEQIRQDTSNLKDETSALKSDTEGFKDNAEQIKNDTLSIQRECEKFAEKCENATSGIDGGIIPCGTKLFEELPSLDEVKKGWMFNISDEFTTTDDFLGGADYYYPAGTNVYAVLCNDELKWDCLGGEMSGYLMKRDFNTTLADAKVEFEEPAELKVVSGITTIKNLFGNVAKIIKLLGKTDLSSAGDDVTSVLKALYDKVGNTDISGIGNGSVTGAISMLNSDISFKVICIGTTIADGNKLPAESQYSFSVKNPDIKGTDIVLATFYIKGTTSKGISTRCSCDNGTAYLNVYSELNLSGSIYFGFHYIIIRAK